MSQTQYSKQKDLLWTTTQNAKAIYPLVLQSEVYDQLFSLQTQQYLHDRNYHWDIQVLPVHQRLNHYALHFSKYVGRLIEASLSEDAQTYQQALTDFFIISLAAANTLNLNLSDEIQKNVSLVDCELSEMVNLIYEKYLNTPNDYFYTVELLALYTGRLAKACESVDHLEKYPFRETIAKYIIHIAIQSMVTASNAELDLIQATQNRLQPIKERFIFHSILSER